MQRRKSPANVASKIYHRLFKKSKIKYVLEAIDFPMRTLTIRCCGKRTLINIDFESAICDPELINGLSPLETVLIGGYYGRALRAATEGRDGLKKAKQMSFLLKDSIGQYRIVSEYRSGEIEYIDKGTLQQFKEYPFAIAQNEYIVSQFDPSQACYIGLLAGISMEKALSHNVKRDSNKRNQLLRAKSALRLVN